MNFDCIEELNFKPESLAVIDRANEFILEYAKQGFTLTLRQLYYQFVSQALIENTERSYKNLGNIITNGRVSGLIPWDGIEDRGRGHSAYAIEEDERNVLSGIEQGITFDFWKRQEIYVECWVEKEALSSVISRPCNRYRVPHMACKGYLSASEMYAAGQRFADASAEGRKLVLLHLGDHDPSGMDMTRDNEDRLKQYSRCDDIEIMRLALNIGQVRLYNPPENPAKITDSRASDYIRQYGDKSWELDALPPQVIATLIESAAYSLIDVELWEETAREETASQQRLKKLFANWPDIAAWIDDNVPDGENESGEGI